MHYFHFCSVLVLLFESYVFQYVNERFDLFGRCGKLVGYDGITGGVIG